MRKSEFSKQQKYSENCVVHNCIKKNTCSSGEDKMFYGSAEQHQQIALRVSWKINKLVVTKRPNEKALIRGLVTVFICIL